MKVVNLSFINTLIGELIKPMGLSRFLASLVLLFNALTTTKAQSTVAPALDSSQHIVRLIYSNKAR